MRDVAYLHLGELGKRVFPVAGSVVLARLLGPGDYGSYALVVALGALLPTLLDSGVAKVVRSRLPGLYAEGRRRALAELLAYAGKVQLLAGALLLIAAPLLLPLAAERLYSRAELGLLAVALCLASVLAAPYRVAAAALEARGEMKAVAALEALSEALRALTLIALVLAGVQLRGLVIGLAGVTALNGLLGAAAYRRHRRRSSPDLPAGLEVVRRLPAVRLGKHLGFSLQIAAGKKLDQLGQALLLLLVGAFAATSAVAFFRIAMALASVPLMFLGPVSRALFVRLAELDARGGRVVYARALQRATLASGLAFLPLVAGFALVLPALLALLYGEAYQPAAQVARVLLFAVAFQGFAVSREALYLFHGKLGSYNLRNAAVLVGWVPVAYLLVRTYQALGAALAFALVACSVLLADALAMIIQLRDLSHDEETG